MDFETDTTHEKSIADLVDSNVHQSTQGLMGKYTAGNSEASGLLNKPSHFNDNLAYGDRATTDAIKSRYQGQFNKNIHALNTQTLKSADADHLRNLQVATNAASQEVELNRQKQLLAWKVKQANKKARGQVIGNVLGIVGTAAGAVVGGMYTAGAGTAAGAAAGGAAGNALGSGIGQMIGEG